MNRKVRHELIVLAHDQKTSGRGHMIAATI